MEEQAVVIVGAGPSGLSLGLCLGKYGVSSIILEKEVEITEDPRGVALMGDANRILWELGVESQINVFGEELHGAYFHKSSFKNQPFFELDALTDALGQTVPNAIMQIQPRLEYALRKEVEKSQYCELRVNCEVVTMEDLPDGAIVKYSDNTGELKSIKCSWLIGADGKTGVVRKQFLEPLAGIKQVTGLFEYTGTWVAANLKINLPTPESHPEFPLWDLGFTPKRVYDLFWPVGWHFCCPPGKPTACGRFGPHQDRFWRHEFAVPEWNDTMDSVELFKEHILPMITRNSDEYGHPFPTGNVTFPQDCMEIRRCRPFTFCQKVVNKWFYNRTILIGDAAHVFPPFAGQGIACGIRDAHGLAWRLVLLLGLSSVTKPLSDEILSAWSRERRQGVDDATCMTIINGNLTNREQSLSFYLYRTVSSILRSIPFIPKSPTPQTISERSGYKPTKDGFHLLKHRGGGKLAQAYIRSSNSQEPILSDSTLRHGKSIMTLIVISEDRNSEEAQIGTLLRSSGIDPLILSEKSLVFVAPQGSTPANADYAEDKSEVYYVCSPEDLGHIKVRPGYDESEYFLRLEGGKYVIVRPDLFIFSISRTVSELKNCLNLLMERLGQ